MLDRVGRDAIGRSANSKRRAAIGRRPALEALEGRQLLTAGFETISNVTSPQYQGFQVPITGTTTHQQTYTVTSDNPGVKASVAQGQFLTLSVSHTSSGAGDPGFDNQPMTFQLFEDLTPNTAKQIESLVTGTATNLAPGVSIGSNYYLGKNIHRIASGFPTPTTYIVQGGSLNGNGTGSVFATPFLDEFTQSLGFTGTGQIAMANSGSDTNDSQFFITTGSPQQLSYHHTIFGQIVEGQAVLNQLTQIAKGADGTTPVNPVTITGASLAATGPDAVIHLDTTLAPAGATANIAVTATDVTDGTTATQTFQTTVGAPYATTVTPYTPLRPFLGAYDQQITVAQGQTARLQIFAVSATPNDPLTYTVQGGVNPPTAASPTATFASVNSSQLTASVSPTGLVTVTPAAGFSGTAQILIGVRDSTNRTGGTLDSPDNYQTHLIRVVVPSSTTTVNQRPLTQQQTVTANLDSATTIRLAGSNQNSTTTPVTFAITTQPTHGTITGFDASTGTVSYTPTPGYLGPDAIAYTATDPTSGLSSFSTAVNINVTNANTGAVRFIPNSSTDTVGTLVVTPLPRTDGGTNTINVAAVNGTVQVTINGVLDQIQQATDNVDRIVVYGSKANDNITIDPSLSTIATLDGGHGGTNVLRAGSGQTREHGWFGKNTLIQGSSDNYQLGRSGIGVKFVKGTGSSNVIFLGQPGYFKRHLNHNRQLPTPTTGRFYKFAGNGKTLVETKNPYRALDSGKTRSENAPNTTGSTSTTRTGTVTAKALAARQAAAKLAAAKVKAPDAPPQSS